jgi:putative (di)nucleoside polyphosphate hydrolase
VGSSARRETVNGRPDAVFRAGVGMIVTDGAGLVLALERSDVPGAWQLPQGGMEEGETAEAAAWRELQEETQLGREHVFLLESLDAWLGYELPEDLRSRKTGRGQVHRWFLFQLKVGVALPPPPPSGGVTTSCGSLVPSRLENCAASELWPKMAKLYVPSPVT